MCGKPLEPGHAEVLELCDEGLGRYREAVSLGSLSPADATPCILSLGLVRFGDDGLLVPVLPATAAESLLRPLREQIAEHQRSIVALEPSFASASAAFASARQEWAGEIRSIRGADRISMTLQLAMDGCREELLTAQPGGQRPPELLGRALESEISALARGVRQRTIYQHAVRSHAPTLDYIRTVVAAGAQVRTLDEVIDRLVICDQAVAYLPGAPRADEAVEVRSPAVVRFLVRVFNNAWERAWPVDSPTQLVRPPELVDEIHAAIMRFLVNGYTDIRIARQLGISRRTVATHIRKISDDLGSTSRAQLGYLIAVRGAVDDGAPNAKKP